MVPRYTYVPLGSPHSEIRLLELLPSTGKDKVHCLLSSARLSELPTYEPLSYCWGPPTQMVEIFVNGGSFLVTRNLSVALTWLRKPDAARILWVDAICINQEDKVEKKDQIPLMADIYQRGKQTIVWLGEHDRRTGRAFAMLETMTQYVNAVSKDKLVQLEPDKWRLLQKVMKKKNAADIEASDFKRARFNPAYWATMIRSWHARMSLFGRPWFKRVWVMQEIAMSQHAIVVCGRYSTSWSTLENVYSMSKLWDEWEDGQCLGSLVGMRTSIQAGRKDEIGKVVQRVVHCEATEPLDRIYAILGLADRLPPSLEIAIDYTADKNTKITEATRVCLSLGNDAQLLFAWHRNPLAEDSTRPSWAWGLHPDPQQPTSQWQFCHARTTQHPFQAAGQGSGQSSLQFSEDGRLLFLRGIVFDKIVETGPVFGSMQMGYRFRRYGTRISISNKGWPEGHALGLYASKRVADPASPGLYPGTNETRRQAWIGFLTGIVMMSVEVTDEQKTREMMRFQDAFMRPFHILGRGPGELPWSKETSLHDPEMPRMTFNMFSSSEMKTLLMGYMAKRRVVRTSNGYIGLSDRHTQAGDCLALVEGICVPVILRPSENKQWKLIGETYVYGVMHGELWSDDKVDSLCIS